MNKAKVKCDICGKEIYKVDSYFCYEYEWVATGHESDNRLGIYYCCDIFMNCKERSSK
jgi:hypothetical protein